MKEQFVTYEIAIMFAELGYYELCLACYSLSDLHFVHSRNSKPCELPSFIAAPLWQQAIDWLDTTHKIRVDLRHSPANGSYGFTIWKVTEPNNLGKWDRFGFPIAFTDRIQRNTRAIEEAIKLIPLNQ